MMTLEKTKNTQTRSGAPFIARGRAATLSFERAQHLHYLARLRGVPYDVVVLEYLAKTRKG